MINLFKLHTLVSTSIRRFYVSMIVQSQRADVIAGQGSVLVELRNSSRHLILEVVSHKYMIFIV